MIRSAIAAALVLSAPVLAEDTRPVVLKERLVTSGSAITLGDLFANSGLAADIAVARAPEPGARLSLDPVYVQNLAAREGLHWANAGGVMRVTVERAARTVSAAELSGMIEEMLFVETGAAHAINLSNTRVSLSAPIDSMGGLEIVSFDHDPRSGLFRAEVRAWEGGGVETVSGRAEAVIDMPVLNRALARGEVITASDISWTRLPSSDVRPAHLASAAELVGMATRRALRPDELVREFDVEAPTLIERGEIVSLIFQSGTLTLAARARAMESASEGESVRFVNLQSNRTVEAVAEAPGRARVVGSSYTH